MKQDEKQKIDPEDQLDDINEEFLEYVDNYNEEHKDELSQMIEENEQDKREERTPFFEKLIKLTTPDVEMRTGAEHGLNSITTMVDSEEQLDDVDEDFLKFVDEFNETLDEDDTDQ